MGGAVHAHVGDGVEPLADVGVDRIEAGDLAAGQEVLFSRTPRHFQRCI
jgi:hypothetical protein